jgi:hypothetical protein
MGVYVYNTSICGRYITIDPVVGTRDDDDDGGGVLEKKQGHISRFLHFALEPTDEVVMIKPPIDNVDDKNDVLVESAHRWLRRNFYFVAERRWSPYGALEVVAGTLANMLEGIPMSTTSRALCIARPACVLVISTVLLVLLVWKVPNAVRLQQWCSLFVTGGMILTCALATCNAVAPSGPVELAGGYVGAVVVGTSMVLGIIETAVLVMTYVPMLRSMFSLRQRGLQSILDRSQINEDVNGGGALHVPMLAVNGGGEVAAAFINANNNNLNDNYIVPVIPQQDKTTNPFPTIAARRRGRPRSKSEEAEVLRKILEDLEEFERQASTGLKLKYRIPPLLALPPY